MSDDARVETTEVRFELEGDTVVGTLYRPTTERLRGPSGAPAVVMAHGLSMTRDSGLFRYAERFARAGIYALTFDYRHFGDSTGTPRELVAARKQVRDYHGALKFFRALPEVDAGRVAIWGTSFSGGVALQCAHEDRKYCGLILQVPNLDNAATARFLTDRFVRKAPVRGLWLVARALMDKFASMTGLPPVYTRAIGRRGEWAAYVNDISADHIDDIRGEAWQNRIALRDFVNPNIFRPVRHAATVPGPIMIVTAERDDITPVGPVLKAAKLAGDRAQLHRHDVTHFEVYTGALFEHLSTQEVAFLERAFAVGTGKAVSRAS